LDFLQKETPKAFARHGGQAEQAKAAKILADTVWIFTEGNEENEGFRSGGGQSPLFPSLSSV
jgi:hypothetical protein